MSQLHVVNSCWQYDNFYTNNNKAFQAAKSILEGVANKLLSKAISKRREPENKDFCISLTYHEAYYLEIACRNVAQMYDPHTYEYNTLQNFANQINEKLA